MNEKSLTPIQKATKEAVTRAISRILGLQDGYIVILRSINIALNGNDALNKNLKKLEANLGQTGMDAEHYFLSILFLDLISEMEIFFSNLIRAIITEHPKKIGAISFKLSEILDSESVDELVAKASDEYLNKLMYKKPMEYLESMCDLLSINMQPLTENWKGYVEAKARRDLGVHNRWTCNTTYLRKLEEACIPTSAAIGMSMFPKYDDYLKNLLDQLSTLVFGIAEHVHAKYAEEVVTVNTAPKSLC